MEKNPGGQNFGNEGEGRFREILSCPPPKCVLPLKCPPPPKFRDLAPPLSAGHIFQPERGTLTDNNFENQLLCHVNNQNW